MSLLDRITSASLENQRLNLIIDKTQPAPPTIHVTKPKRIKPDLLTSKIVTKDLNDQELLLQNDKIGKISRRRNQVPKVLSKLENDMIKEFELTAIQGFKSVDPETGLEIYRKYNIEGLNPPDLDTEPAGIISDFLDKEITDYDIRVAFTKIEQERQAHVFHYEVVKQELSQLEKNIETLQNRINQGNLSNMEKKTLLLSIKRDETMLVRKKVEANQLAKSIDTDANLKKQSVMERAEQHNALVKVKRQENLERIKQYQVQLNLLNSNAFNTSKMENESEAEYLERLRRNAEEVLPQELLENAFSQANMEFKKRVNQITRDAVKVEQICNSFNSEEKYQLIQIWRLVLDKYNKAYGITNKSVEAETIVAFFQSLLNKEQSISELPEAVQEVIREKEEPEILSGKLIVTPIVEENTLKVQKSNVNNQPPVYFRSVNIHSKGEHGMNALLYSFTGETGTFKQYFDEAVPSNRTIIGVAKMKSSKEIYDKTGITTKDLNELVGYTTDSFNPNVFSKRMSIKFKLPQFTVMDTTQSKYSVYSNRLPDKTEYGMGIHKSHEPKLVHFGSVMISLPNLKYKNVLSIRTHLGKTIGGLSDKKISAKMTSIILNLLDKVQPTHEELYRLTNEERHLYDRLIHLGRLHTELPHTNDKTVTELKKRLKLLEGELEIGNNSPLIKKEIKHILRSLKDFHIITPKQIKEYEKNNF
jgi:hypothetical protein